MLAPVPGFQGGEGSSIRQKRKKYSILNAEPKPIQLGAHGQGKNPGGLFPWRNLTFDNQSIGAQGPAIGAQNGAPDVGEHRKYELTDRQGVDESLPRLIATGNVGGKIGVPGVRRPGNPFTFQSITFQFQPQETQGNAGGLPVAHPRLERADELPHPA